MHSKQESIDERDKVVKRLRDFLSNRLARFLHQMVVCAEAGYVGS
jgi:hypothetical protein